VVKLRLNSKLEHLEVRVTSLKFALNIERKI
jgi:hypothetical protein